MQKENKALREEINRWCIQNEELRRVIIVHESKTRVDRRQVDRLKWCESEMREIIRLLRRNDLNAMADGIEARMDSNDY